jgi:hypothetical protein
MNEQSSYIRTLNQGKELLVFMHGEEWWNAEYDRVVVPFLENLLGYEPDALRKLIEAKK